MPPAKKNHRTLIGVCSALVLLFLINSFTNGSFLYLGGSSSSSNFGPVKGIPNYIYDGRNGGLSSVVTAAKSLNPDGTCSAPTEFVVVLDAAPSNTNVRIFEFDVCYYPPRLIGETTQFVTPGISHYSDDVRKLVESIKSLLDKAVETVPAEKRACTPITLKVDPSLSVAGEEFVNEALTQLTQYIDTMYPFPLIKNDGVSVISSNERGMYMWIATNYLLGNLGTGQKSSTSGILDLERLNSNVVFEPEMTKKEKNSLGPDYVKLNLYGTEHILYQHSYEDYGLVSGRTRVNTEIVRRANKAGEISRKDTETLITLAHPCLPPYTHMADLKIVLKNGDAFNVDFIPSEQIDLEACTALAKSVFDKDSKCSEKPCSFDGVHQPTLSSNLKDTNDLYIHSYFVEGIIPLGVPSSFNIDELDILAKKVCAGPQAWNELFSSIPNAITRLKNHLAWCPDLMYQIALMEHGLGVPKDKELKAARSIGGQQASWNLGAALPILYYKNYECKSGAGESSI